MDTVKKCGKCGVEKDFFEFSPMTKGRFGLNFWCKACHREYQKNRRLTSPEFRESKREYNVLEWSTRPESEKEAYNKKRRERHAADPDKANNYAREFRRANPHIQKKQNENKMDRYRTDPDFRLKETLRTRLRQAIVSQQKKGSAVRDLGCSISELRAHLESKFQPGMSWSNWGYGKDKWNIDHIIPLTHYNLSDQQHFLLANNYENLQPLWQIDNFKKHDTYPIFPWAEAA